MDFYLILLLIFISVIIGKCITKMCNCNSILATSIIVLIIYIMCDYMFLDNINTINTINTVNNTNMVNNTRQSTNNIGVKFPIMSEIDSLDPNSLMKKIQSFYKTSKHNYPYIPTNYQDKVIEKSNLIGKNKTHLAISKMQYPQLTEDQYNYNDCTNFGWNDALSCIQPPDNNNLRPMKFGEFEHTLVEPSMLSSYNNCTF